MANLTPKVPEYCLICGADWRGGHNAPLQHMELGLRVFYECGASLSCKDLGNGAYQLLIKNCSLNDGF